MEEESLHLSDPRLIDGYAIVARLGEGASGIVFRAVQPDGSEVALKVLRSELANDPQVRERLRREAVALQRVVGGRTAKVLRVEADGEYPYLAMELVPGSSLNLFVEQHGPLRSGLLWSVALGLIEALASIHAAGVIHRDLKPSNIMIGSDGVKVVDFGVSALQEVSSLTGTGTFIGTASWVSPEQVIGRPITEASDVFSLGIVLAYASSGVHPFGSGRADAVMFRIAHEPADLSAIPDGLRSLIESCLNKNSQLRPTLDVLEGLMRALSFYSDSGGAGEPSGGGTMIVGQTVIESGMQTTELAAGPSTISSASKLKATQKQLALVAAVVAVVTGVVFVSQKSKSDTSIKNADVVNTGVKTTVPDPIDVFSLSLNKFVAKSSAGVRTEDFGLDPHDPEEDNFVQMWGIQLDCSDYYPLYDLGFGDSSVSLASGRMTNSKGGNGEYMIEYRFFTDFSQDPMNFTRRVAVAESKFASCDDEDYVPSWPEIGPCIGRVFKDVPSAFPTLDEACAKKALKTVKWDKTSQKNLKYGWYPDTSVNDRTGTQYIFVTTPGDSDNGRAAVQWATAMVWERENIGLVLAVSGWRNDEDIKSETIRNNALSLLYDVAFTAQDLVVDAFGS